MNDLRGDLHQNSSNIQASQSNGKSEKVVWKSKMINDLQEINKFLNDYNVDNRKERVILKQ